LTSRHLLPRRKALLAQQVLIGHRPGRKYAFTQGQHSVPILGRSSGKPTIEFRLGCVIMVLIRSMTWIRGKIHIDIPLQASSHKYSSSGLRLFAAFSRLELY
jgi:hypothetical protein